MNTTPQEDRTELCNGLVEALNDGGWRLRFCIAEPQQIVNGSDLGITLGWNETAKWYQPYVSISIWKVMYQVGFLYDDGK